MRNVFAATLFVTAFAAMPQAFAASGVPGGPGTVNVQPASSVPAPASARGRYMHTVEGWRYVPADRVAWEMRRNFAHKAQANSAETRANAAQAADRADESRRNAQDRVAGMKDVFKKVLDRQAESGRHRRP